MIPLWLSLRSNCSKSIKNRVLVDFTQKLGHLSWLFGQQCQ
jgi:hypothetical protein